MGGFQLIYTAHIYRDMYQYADIKKDQNKPLVFLILCVASLYEHRTQ
ncbi:hypothetical protein M917_2842 [Psychrobacter aquaticus CMS 56]|uniref:Uncharacterized protein n=1 Tax=Psychrobacter aquaticus CMS 56 TaxID=1354303 RepID=U4T1Q0_9GAMM|nr:hypothetical protein M917_2842 [Psychrobacter aquaticus CMS 56]